MLHTEVAKCLYCVDRPFETGMVNDAKVVGT